MLRKHTARSLFLKAGLVLLGLAIVTITIVLARGRGPAPVPTGETPFGIDWLPEGSDGLTYQLKVQREPRPLRIHCCQADLSNDSLEIASAVSPDPDGAGPAEGQLEDPRSLASRYDLLVGINANAFSWVRDSSAQRDHAWEPGEPVEIYGLAASCGKLISPPESAYVSIWTDREGRKFMGLPSHTPGIEQAASGYGWLTRDGRIVAAGRGKAEPRSALGLDRSGSVLTFLVAEGRNPGYSEGMTLRELAGVMQEFGCWNAVNLDGGGSSVLVVASGGRQVVASVPSHRVRGRPACRPVPVMLGVRKKSAGERRAVDDQAAQESESF